MIVRSFCALFIAPMMFCVCACSSSSQGLPLPMQLDETGDVRGDSLADMMPEDMRADEAVDDTADVVQASCDDLQAGYITNPAPLEDPPYSGTVWYSPDILIAEDPSSFQGVVYQGQGERQMYDRRTSSFNMVNAHLFDATFGVQSQVVVEVQVNPEFDQATAQQHAVRHAEVVGKLPAFYFRDLQTMWIHAGKELYGGGNNNFLIHTGQSDEYERDGVLEEVFLHEGGHTSLDAYHANSPLWLSAQRADGVSISDYGRDNPLREDISETIGPYLAITHRADRVPQKEIDEVRQAIPNRIKYLDCQGFTMDILK